jgi:hypothetical protein
MYFVVAMLMVKNLSNSSQSLRSRFAIQTVSSTYKNKLGHFYYYGIIFMIGLGLVYGALLV